jgi:hypothetical protein
VVKSSTKTFYKEPFRRKKISATKKVMLNVRRSWFTVHHVNVLLLLLGGNIYTEFQNQRHIHIYLVHLNLKVDVLIHILNEPEKKKQNHFKYTFVLIFVAHTCIYRYWLCVCVWCVSMSAFFRFSYSSNETFASLRLI